MTVFWNVARCSLVETDRRFRGAYCLHHLPDDGAVRASPRLVNFYETTPRNIPEDCHLHTRRLRSWNVTQHKDALNTHVMKPAAVTRVGSCNKRWRRRWWVWRSGYRLRPWNTPSWLHRSERAWRLEWHATRVSWEGTGTTCSSGSDVGAQAREDAGESRGSFVSLWKRETASRG
jgi:hypothetical protein